jgi:hypothetical protein
MQDQQIVEPTERGHTLSCSMRGFFRAEERTSVMRMRLTGGPLSAEELDQNRALRILSVWGKGSGLLALHARSGEAVGRCVVAGAILTRAYATCMLHQMIHRPS